MLSQIISGVDIFRRHGEPFSENRRHGVWFSEEARAGLNAVYQSSSPEVHNDDHQFALMLPYLHVSGSTHLASSNVAVQTWISSSEETLGRPVVQNAIAGLRKGNSIFFV